MNSLFRHSGKAFSNRQKLKRQRMCSVIGNQIANLRIDWPNLGCQHQNDHGSYVHVTDDSLTKAVRINGVNPITAI